ncbi:MAG: DUF1365 domain-containing protein [Hyphomicrobium sp.]|nr:DUF1365 domain-containing protein [Hyphomicrobium sp.]
MISDAAIYAGHVVHKRLRPKPHTLRYRVFSVLVDIEEIDALAARLRLFSRNRFNLFSLYDRDHGPGDGTDLIDIARTCLKNAQRPHENRRILLLCYPRILGYVFNPLSVYYVYAPDGALETLIYEVNNTFGERTSYVVAAGDVAAGGVYAQACAKRMYVSPFANGRGGYAFRITEPDGTALVAVMLSDTGGPLIKTHFRAAREDMTDRRLAGLLARYPLLTLKVIAAIHYEALKLWLKGVPLTDRHKSPRYSTVPSELVNKG